MEEIAFGLTITMSKIPVQQVGIQRVSQQPTSGREVQKINIREKRCAEI